MDPPRPPQTLSGPALVPPVSPRERPGTRHGRPERAQVHTRDTPSAPKHAKDLDKDVKGHPKAPLLAPIAGNTTKTNVFSMFLKAPEDPQGLPSDPQGPPGTPQGPPKDPRRTPLATPRRPLWLPRPSQCRPESAQVHTRDIPRAPKYRPGTPRAPPSMLRISSRTPRGTPRPPCSLQ